MPDPNSPHVFSVPSPPDMPYDATEPDGNRVDRWEKVRSGHADLHTGRLTGEDWPGDDHWQQT